MAGTSHTPPPTAVAAPEDAELRFVNALRLGLRHWLAVGGLLALLLPGIPWAWKTVERFDTAPDYRIPYALSRDYWLYERRLSSLSPTSIVLVGDSVVWGEYVRPDGALSHFLNEESGPSARFVNAGVNGLFPLALEGLIRHHAGPLRHRRVLLHANVLWMSSPKADLHTEKEERFNHAGLVPQFSPRIPCYKADLNQRLAAVVIRNFTFAQWADHLQTAYFDQKNLLAWTLAEDPSDPSRLPNALRNPLARITLEVPAEPPDDPDRGPSSPRHKPWSTQGAGSTHFDWVPLDRSLQWAAFQRLVKVLQSRGNDVMVLVGPFNEHLLAPENRDAFRHLQTGITQWLTERQIPHLAPEPLPSRLYADASHPLTEGYARLAKTLSADPTFQQWRDAR